MKIPLLALLTSFAFDQIQAAHTAASNSTPAGVLHRRQFFYVGGEYIAGGTSEISHGQMFVEHLVPANVTKSTPIIFIHGLAMTGTNFLNTPDGRIGWADYFMSLGYEVCTFLRMAS